VVALSVGLFQKFFILGNEKYFWIIYAYDAS
jgi:hypothetical protein